MSFGADCLIQKINDRIAALEGCSYNAAQLSGALNSIETYHCVPDVSSLPSAACNEGRFIYVEDIKSFRYSDGYYWTKDACSVLGDPSSASTLWTWGRNANGQLGDGTTVDRCSPGTILGGGTTWCDSSGASQLRLAIKTDGTIWTWGAGFSGALGNGTTVDRCSPGTIAGGGTTWCTIGLSNPFTVMAIKTDGTLWTWGYSGQGALGNGTIVNRCSPGTVAGGGTNWSKLADVFGSYNGAGLSIAIKTDGTLWTWGNNTQGRLGDGTTVSRCSPGTIAGGGTTWCAAAASSISVTAIKTDGTLWTWGCNCRGKLGDGTTVDRCSPGTVAGGGTTWSIVRADSMAIKTDGTLWTWGYNSVGQLGNGTTVDRCSPGTVAGGGTTWCDVSYLSSAIAAIKTDGTLWTWGQNQFGRHGNGTIVNRCSPGTVSGGGTIWCRVTGGDGHVNAITTRGF